MAKYVEREKYDEKQGRNAYSSSISQLDNERLLHNNMYIEYNVQVMMMTKYENELIKKPIIIGLKIISDNNNNTVTTTTTR